MTMATYEEGILALKSCPETVTLAVQENYSKLNMMPPWNKRDTFFIRYVCLFLVLKFLTV